MNWLFHPEAKEDLNSSAEWYEARKPGLGFEFLQEVDLVIKRILIDPEKARKIAKDTRRCNLKRFPFVIVYRVRAGDVEILAVAHHSRRPGYWQSRSGNET